MILFCFNIFLCLRHVLFSNIFIFSIWHHKGGRWSCGKHFCIFILELRLDTSWSYIHLLFDSLFRLWWLEMITMGVMSKQTCVIVNERVPIVIQINIQLKILQYVSMPMYNVLLFEFIKIFRVHHIIVIIIIVVIVTVKYRLMLWIVSFSLGLSIITWNFNELIHCLSRLLKIRYSFWCLVIDEVLLLQVLYLHAVRSDNHHVIISLAVVHVVVIQYLCHFYNGLLLLWWLQWNNLFQNVVVVIFNNSQFEFILFVFFWTHMVFFSCWKRMAVCLLCLLTALKRPLFKWLYHFSAVLFLCSWIILICLI